MLSVSVFNIGLCLTFVQGAISDSNFGKLQKIAWTRCARTDKGVHAAGNVISAKVLLLNDGLNLFFFNLIFAES
jgi:hypothetical protein